MALLGNETFTRQPHLGTRNANEATERPAQKDSMSHIIAIPLLRLHVLFQWLWLAPDASAACTRILIHPLLPGKMFLLPELFILLSREKIVVLDVADIIL